MDKYELKAGDIVTLNATVIGISANKNPIIKLDSGMKFLVKETDINTICPKIEIPEKDMRTGR